MHGGTVEKFIGDAIMTVFGVPVAHDDDAERAIRAAFRMRERLEELNAGASVAYQLRIGVTTGEAVADTDRTEQFLVTGPPVSLAARFETAAPPGEILVDAVTRQLTRAWVAYGDPREVDAKGYGKVTAWPARFLTTAIPLEVREGRSAPLVGRDAELTILREEFARAVREGMPSLVTISGPPGVGKTRLVTELTELIGLDHSFFGRCLPFGQGITLYPIRQILRGHFGIEHDDDQARASARVSARLASVVADDRERAAVFARVSAVLGLSGPGGGLEAISASNVADELRWGVRRYFERASAHEPCMLVFEDIHRAEDGLLDLIEYLAASPRARILIVCLARPEFAEMRKAWGRSAARASSITLGPLPDPFAHELVAALDARAALDAAGRTALVARAEGNPLYIEELLRVVSDPTSVTGIGERRGPAAVPATLHGVIAARLDRVSPELKALLYFASLVGRSFSTAALEAIGGQRVRAELLVDAVGLDLLVEAAEPAVGGGRAYRFKHGLIQEVAYGTVPKGERVRLHDNYGRWLERTFGDRRAEVAEIVAHHAEQAFLLADDLGREADALGRRALDLLIAIAIDAQHRQDQSSLGMYERASVVAARLRSDTPQRAEAVAGRAITRYWRYGEREQLALARDLFHGAAPTETYVRLLMAMAYVAFADGRPDAYFPVLDEAISAARHIGDPNVVTEVLGVRANAAYQNGDAATYVRLIDEALDYARANGGTRELPRLLILRFIMATRQAEFALAFALDRELQASAPPPLSTGEVAWLARRSALLHAIGDNEGSIAISERSLRIAREHGTPIVLALQLWHFGEALLALARSELALDALLEAKGLFLQLGQRAQIPEVAARCARARVRLGDLAGAREELDIAEAALLETDVESVSIVALANAELAAARGELVRADDHFRASIKALEPSMFRVYLAQARVAYGAFLIARGRSADAQGQLAKARIVYSEDVAARRRAEIDLLLKRCEVRVT